jgi:3-hydroxy-9,10-secoandrosta-1,3,5(10)-triene-9,17-dione monooxygenase
MRNPEVTKRLSDEGSEAVASTPEEYRDLIPAGNGKVEEGRRGRGNPADLMAPSFAGVTHEEAVARARNLVPRLRERAAQAEIDRALSPESLRELNASGVMRALQPKRWGGMELEFITYFDVTMELARGCASTAWNVSQVLMHHWLLAMYDERTQQEVWSQDPEAVIATGIAFPQGQGRKIDGGYVISGRWNFSSCVNMSDWNMLAATVRDGERIVDHRLCLLHKSQYEVVDDWQVLGMRATRSMSVSAKDVFVPERKTLSMYETRGGDGFPGAGTNPHPVFRVPVLTLGGHGVVACAVGNAQAALDHMIASVKERSTNYTGMKMRDFQTVQLRIGEAGAKIDTARLLMRNDCIEGQETANRNLIADRQTKLRYKRNAAFAAGLCNQAVDTLHAMAGANGIYQAFPLERIFRDAHALTGHVTCHFDTHVSAWGLVALGGEINNPTL